MPDPVELVGLDFGTTTMSAVVAEAQLTRNAVTGRTDLDLVRERYRSELVLTPLAGERIDEAAVTAQLERWLQAGGVCPERIFGGGALLTGLTARRDNAGTLVRLIRQRLGDALIATADDPCLESWLAFMGSCGELSRANPELSVLNLDIGGGTTNLALGQAGAVLRTGCLIVGARHVQVEPGSYRIVRLSSYARALFRHLGIAKDVGDTLTDREVNAVLSFYVDLLEAAAAGKPFDEPTARLHEQVPFQPVPGGQTPLITVCGGVGELIYGYLDGKPWPATTAFGDLGIDLARKLAHGWAGELHRRRPASAGRATVYGLLRHATEISGSTLYLPNPAILPLPDLPILGNVSVTSPDEDLSALIELAGRSERGACLRVAVGSFEAAAVRAVGTRIAAALERNAFPPGRALVLLASENVGKVLGQYAGRWGTLPVELMVIDEVPDRNAQYVRLGRPRQQVVPVSFYGFNEAGEMS
jgi:ethanolamine utilization protein EutA